MRAPLSLCAVFFAWGCGPSLPGVEALRRELEASGLEQARPNAPDLVDAANDAAAAAERAEAAGDLTAARDHSTRARLLADAALAERERVAAEHERVELEGRALELEDEIVRNEREARAIEEDAARTAAVRAAREELARAFAVAEIDEATTRRSGRVSLADEPEMRRAAIAIRERARILAAAAAAMGADAASVENVETLATRSASTAGPLESLSIAEDAYRAARAALGAARRARPGPTVEEIAAAVEAAETDGFRAVRLERGLGIEATDVFRPGSARPGTAGAGRIARLAALLASHPHGAVTIEVDVAGSGEGATRLARDRGEWARRALVDAGVPAERVTHRPPDATMPSPDPGERLRVVLVAYSAP
jgi:hypothetical protein